MSKILRVLVTFVGASILLVLLAIIGLVVFVNPNDLKPQISQAVAKYTGRELQLAGNIEWSIFPWLGLELNDAKLSNTPGFGDKPFAQIQKLDIQVRLLPLLHKQLEIGRLHAKGLMLYLVKNAQGKNNWQVSLTPSTATTSNKPTNNLKPLGFVVAGLDIQNGYILFDDRQKNKRFEVAQLQLKSANLTVDKRSPFFAQFNLRTNAPKLDATVKLASDLTLGAAAEKILLNKLNLDVLLKDPTYPKGQLPIALQADLMLDLDNQTFASEKFTITIAQNKFIGRIAGQNLLSDPSVSGVLTTEQFRSDKFIIQQIQLPFQFKSNTLSLNPITAKLYQGTYRGDVMLDLTTAIPRLIAHNQLTQVNVQSLFQAFNNKSQIQLAGLANINSKYATQGSDRTSMIKNLQGQGQLHLNNGAIKGINLSYWIALGKALLKHDEKPTASGPDTPFSTFSASFTIDKGILVNNDLTIRSGRFNINGKGSIDLPQQQIAYELQAQAVLANGSPDGIAIPIRITGQFNHIVIAPILDKLSLDIVKEKIKGTLQEQLKKLDLKKIFQ
jgi:AsmA protein